MRPSFSTPRFLAAALLLSLLALACLLPGLGGGFIFDDQPNLLENGALHLQSLSLEAIAPAAYSFQPGHGSRALTMLSFALDYWRGGGLNPQVFKSTNLAIHALTTLALAAFFQKLLSLSGWPARRAALTALAMAALWALHPLQVSSVLYVVQRMQTLGTLFLVLALWAYLAARQKQLLGASGRAGLALTGLCWLLAFAAKEDAALLPAYLFVLELTVLRYRAAHPSTTLALRRGYQVAIGLGVCAYLLVVLPHFWSWGDYPGRVFSTPERLLTQGRVLMMYIGQILLPLPERLPFYYDTLQISRGLLDPPTTLVAWTAVAALLALAGWVRTRRPLFACGVLLFFAGHFVTSNVIGLEMAFEHRNHFPLIGAALALGDLAWAAWPQGRRARWLATTLVVGVLAAAGAATLTRAYAWGEPLRFARYSVGLAPDSERPWLALAELHASRSGMQPNSPALQQAIDVLNTASKRLDSPLVHGNLVSYKTMQGTVTPADWGRLLQKLRLAPMTMQNKSLIWVMIRNTQRGIPMDETGMAEMLAIVSARGHLDSEGLLRIAAYLYSNTRQPEHALPYLIRAVKQAPAGDPQIDAMLVQIANTEHADWARQLGRLRKQR